MPLDESSTYPVNSKTVVTHVLGNTLEAPDRDVSDDTGDVNAIGFRNNGEDYSGNSLGHPALPATHGTAIKDFLSDGNVGVGIANPLNGFEYGVGPQAIRDKTALTGLSGLKHLELAIKANYFDSLNEPISDISG